MRINGMKVVDAQRKLSIHITKQDIANGKMKSPGNCAAAQSILREVAGCTEARVHLAKTYIKTGKVWVRYETPRSLRSEIIAFDRGARFATGEHSLTPSAPSQQLGSGYGGGKRSPDRTKVKRKSPHVVYGVRHTGAVGVKRTGA